MSIKIKVSYQEEHEARLIMGLLKPIIPFFKVKKSEGTLTGKPIQKQEMRLVYPESAQRPLQRTA